MRQPRAARRRRHRPAALLHRPVAGAGVAGGVRAAVRAAGRVRLRDVGVAVRPDLAARHPTVRHARLGPAAPDARGGQRGPGRRRRRLATSGSARPASCCCATRWSRRATGRCRRRPPTTDRGRLAAHRRPRDRERRRDLHVRVPAQGGAAPARPEPVARRGRGRRSSAHPDVLEVAVVAVPSELTEDEVKAFVVAGAGTAARLRRAARLDRGTAVGVQGAAVLAGSGRAAAHADRPGRQAPAAGRAPARRVRRPAAARRAEDRP